MAGRPGQALTAREVEEIELSAEQGFARPAKYDTVMYDSNAGGYRYMTAEERRAGDESAKQQARLLQARERASTQIREAAQGRGVAAEVGAIEDAEEGALTEETVTTFSTGNAGVTEAPISGATETPPAAPTPAPKPMPASLANAMRQAGPPKKSAPAEAAPEGQG